jgi:hypothetical protein
MKRTSIAAWTIVVLALSSMVFAQAAWVEIPKSSVARRGDAGKFAHTNTMIYHPLGDSGFSTVPPPTANTPASLACAYHLVTPLVTGCPINGTTVNPTGGHGAIAIVDAFDDPNAAADLATYSTQFGLPAANFTVVFASGSRPPVDTTGGWELEEALDIQMAHAMAPAAQLFLVEATNNSFGALFQAEQVAAAMVSAAGGGTVSNSWSSSEFSSETSDDHFFTGSNVVFFASAGDGGLVPGYPSVSPNVVSAGGTALNRTNGLLTSETYWNTGGPGISERFAERGIGGRHGAEPDQWPADLRDVLEHRWRRRNQQLRSNSVVPGGDFKHRGHQARHSRHLPGW